MTKIFSLGIFIGLSFILTACPDDNPASPLITQVQQEDEDQIRQVEDTLFSHSIGYDGRYKAFSRGDKVISKACAPEFLGDLRESLEIVTKVSDSLTPQSDLYREKALDFYRKATNMKKSLEELYQPLSEYCTTDHKIVAACLWEDSAKIGKEPVVFWFNRHTSGYGLVHPMVLPNIASSIALTTNTLEDSDYRTILTASGVQNPSSPFDSLIDITTEAELSKISDCLQTSKAESSISKIIKQAALNSFKGAEKECNDRGYTHRLRDFCIPEALGERPEKSVLDRDDFKAYFQGLVKLSDHVQSIRKALEHSDFLIGQFKKASQPLDPSDPFTVFDKIDGGTEEQRVARLKKDFGDNVRFNLEKIVAETALVEKLLQEFPVLAGRSIFAGRIIKSATRPQGNTYVDLTNQRLIKLNRRAPLDDQRVALFSRLFNLKNGAENVLSPTLEVRLKSYAVDLDIQSSRYTDGLEKLGKLLASLNVITHPSELLGGSEDHEEIIAKVLDYKP